MFGHTSRVPAAGRGRWVAVGTAAAMVAVLAAASAARERGSAKPSIEVLFSPDGGCAERICDEIKRARKHVRVQMHVFTSRTITSALTAARKRGVKVEVILDGSQEKQRYAQGGALKRGGVTLRYDREHEVANNKVLLIDDTTIITGSYNFSRAAEEKNAENVLILRHHPELMQKYFDNFAKHFEHSSGA